MKTWKLWSTERLEVDVTWNLNNKFHGQCFFFVLQDNIPWSKKVRKVCKSKCQLMLTQRGSSVWENSKNREIRPLYRLYKNDAITFPILLNKII